MKHKKYQWMSRDILNSKDKLYTKLYSPIFANLKTNFNNPEYSGSIKVIVVKIYYEIIIINRQTENIYIQVGKKRTEIRST